MKTSQWLVIAMAAAVAAGGVTGMKTEAAPGAGPLVQRRGAVLEHVKEKLGLSEEQAARIKAELRAERETIASLLTRLRSARAGLRDTIQQEGATEDTIRAASARVAEVQADIAVERARLHGKISPILTAEQRGRLKEFQQRVDGFLDRVIETIGERLATE
jgi:Spy/CpxP family protein refolding chaperone